MQSGPSSRASVPWRARLGTLLLALTCITAHLYGVAHMALVRHVTCVEHGELMHVGDVRAPGDADGRPRPGSRPEVRDGALDQAGEHEHCGVAAHLRKALALRGPAAAPVLEGPAPSPPGVAVVRSPAASADRAPALALFLLAPKTSPPV